MDGAFSRAELAAALAESGGNKARLARALGVEPPRINEWLSGKVENTKYTRRQLAAAIAVARGDAPDGAPDQAALLNALEEDARRMLERIRRARIGAPTPSQVEAALRTATKGKKAQ